MTPAERDYFTLRERISLITVQVSYLQQYNGTTLNADAGSVTFHATALNSCN